MSRPLVCLDKDGTLVENVPYNVEAAAIRLAPGAAEGIRLLHRSGYRLVVVTNQPGIALGHIDEAAFATAMDRVAELCADAGGRIEGVYHCPHAAAPSGDPICGCRKPMAGLIERALRDYGANPAESWVVGDILDDVEAGRRARCRSILVDNGNETEWAPGPLRRPDHVVRDLAQAARLIVAPALVTDAEAISA